MVKMIAFDQEARDAIKRGVGKLTRTVRSTFGPCGHTVLLAKSFGPPTVTKDGVTVAKEIDLEDPYENIATLLLTTDALFAEKASGGQRDRGHGGDIY
jgi:chaperonin GroEL